MDIWQNVKNIVCSVSSKRPKLSEYACCLQCTCIVIMYLEWRSMDPHRHTEYTECIAGSTEQRFIRPGYLVCDSNKPIPRWINYSTMLDGRDKLKRFNGGSGLETTMTWVYPYKCLAFSRGESHGSYESSRYAPMWGFAQNDQIRRNSLH